MPWVQRHPFPNTKATNPPKVKPRLPTAMEQAFVPVSPEKTTSLIFKGNPAFCFPKINKDWFAECSIKLQVPGSFDTAQVKQTEVSASKAALC